MRFWEIGLQSWQTSKNNGWVPTFRGGGTHWVFLATPWFFVWITVWLKVNPVRELRESCSVRFCEINLQSWHISQNNWLSSYVSLLAVLIEFSLWHPGSLNEHSLTEGQSTVRELRESCPVRFWEIGLQSWQISKNNGWVPTFRGGGTHLVFLVTPWFFAWIIVLLKVNPVRELREYCSVRFWEIGLQSWHISQNNWLSSYVSWGRYSLSFRCDTLVLCMHPAWLKVNKVRELRESCPVRFLWNWLTKLAYFTKIWLSSYGSCWQYSLSFPCNTLVLCLNTVCLKVNPVRELRESCPLRFWEIGLQIWQI